MFYFYVFLLLPLLVLTSTDALRMLTRRDFSSLLGQRFSNDGLEPRVCLYVAHISVIRKSLRETKIGDD